MYSPLYYFGKRVHREKGSEKAGSKRQRVREQDEDTYMMKQTEHTSRNADGSDRGVVYGELFDALTRGKVVQPHALVQVRARNDFPALYVVRVVHF